jgi:hypothetical protein
MRCRSRRFSPLGPLGIAYAIKSRVRSLPVSISQTTNSAPSVFQARRLSNDIKRLWSRFVEVAAGIKHFVGAAVAVELDDQGGRSG